MCVDERQNWKPIQSRTERSQYPERQRVAADEGGGPNFGTDSRQFGRTRRAERQFLRRRSKFEVFDQYHAQSLRG
jgi:hypothetical protein